MSNPGQQPQPGAGDNSNPAPGATNQPGGPPPQSPITPYPAGYGPPPPLPGNRPDAAPGPGAPQYAAPQGPPPTTVYGYTPPAGPPPTQSYAPPPGPPPPQGYAPPPGGHAPPPGPPPAQGYAPPAGDRAPPPGAPPPQGYAPPAGGHAPPPGPPPPQGYAPPAGGHAPPPGPPPPQGQAYAPPPGPPPPQGYAARDGPPASHEYPATPQFPLAQANPLPPGFPTAPGGYGAFPQQPAAAPFSQFPAPAQLPLVYLGSAIPDPNAPPTPHGVTKVPGYDPAKDAEAIKKAVKGFGTDDALLISTLVKIPVLQMDALVEYYVAKAGKRMIDVLDSETSSWFGMGIHALATGPLAWDVELAKKALAGAGTNEALLTELVLGRPATEVRLLMGAYRFKYGKDLVDQIRGDLSGKTLRLFLMALSANPPPDDVPVDQTLVATDVEELFKAGQGKSGTDEMKFCDVLTARSRPHLSAVIGMYGNKYRSLTKVIKAEFSGHMRSAFLYIVEGAKPKRDGRGIWRDAKMIDKAMVGFGTRDMELVWRIVRAHWDPVRMEAVKEAYMHRTRKTLESRVASETSGSYKKLMVAIVSGAGMGAVMSAGKSGKK